MDNCIYNDGVKGGDLLRKQRDAFVRCGCSGTHYI